MYVILINLFNRNYIFTDNKSETQSLQPSNFPRTTQLDSNKDCIQTSWLPATHLFLNNDWICKYILISIENSKKIHTIMVSKTYDFLNV